MNKRGWITILKLVGLIITIICSFIAYLPVNTPTISLIPGLLFTLYMIISYFRYIQNKSLIYIYPLFYCFIMVVAFVSWGLSVPILGALGGWLTKFIFLDSKWRNKESYEFCILGLVGSTIGFIFYIVSDFAIGVKFGVIIGCWQLFIGLKMIYAVHKLS